MSRPPYFNRVYTACVQFCKYFFLACYLILALVLLVGWCEQQGLGAKGAKEEDPSFPQFWFSAQLSRFYKGFDVFLTSPVYQLFVQSAFIVFFSWALKTLKESTSLMFVFLGGKPFDVEAPEDLIDELRYERLNITLNILEEGCPPYGRTYPKPTAQKQGQGHKIHMRTIHESSLMDCFGGEQDPWVLKTMLKGADQPWEASNPVAPFLSAVVLKGLSDTKMNSFTKQMTDQVINRLSMLFGGAYVAQDQGLDYKSSQYVFGLTYEKPDENKNTRQKVRCLVMKETSLKRLCELWDEDPLHFDFHHNAYSEHRCLHLINMYRIYKDRSILESVVKRIGQRNDAEEKEEEEVEEQVPVMGCLIYHLHIAAQGHIQVIPA